MSLLEEQLEEIRKRTAAAGVTPEMVSASSVDSGLLGIEAPQHWTQEAMDRDGKGKFFGKMLLGGFTGLTPLLFPEMIGAKERYKTDLALYQKAQEMAMVDPQDQALADAILNGTTGRELMALQALAGGVDKLNMDQATLSPGQIRYDTFGNVVAQGGDPVVNPTAAIQDAEAIANTRGIPLGSPFFGDLVAAVTEPTETRTDENGNTYSVNTVSEVLSRWDAEQARSQAQPAASPETRNQDPNTLGPVLSGLNEKQAQLVTDAPDKLKFYERFGTNLAQLGEWDAEKQRFILNEDVTDLYGSWDGNPLNPQNWNGFGDDGDGGGFGGSTELFMPQGNRDAKAVIEQLIESLAVDERGQLKGQGQITEGETAMLRAAVTRAAKRGMGDKAAEDEFTRLYLEYEKALKEQQGLVDRYWPSRRSGGEPEIIDLDA